MTTWNVCPSACYQEPSTTSTAACTCRNVVTNDKVNNSLHTHTCMHAHAQCNHLCATVRMHEATQCARCMMSDVCSLPLLVCCIGSGCQMSRVKTLQCFRSSPRCSNCKSATETCTGNWQHGMLPCCLAAKQQQRRECGMLPHSRREHCVRSLFWSASPSSF